MILVTGGSGSGKSAYAENRMQALSGTKYYIATMQIFGSEEQKKVERHQRLRRDKGFITIEKQRDIHQVAFQEKAHVCALLECMSNLTANEIFGVSQRLNAETAAAKIMADLRVLGSKTEHLVIVTNNVFEDGITYDEGTMEYLRTLGSINQELAKMADEVIELVAGIPIIWKEGHL